MLVKPFWPEGAYAFLPGTASSKFLRKLAIILFSGLSCLLFPHTVTGLERLPQEGPFVIIANHQSIFDLALLHPLWPQNIRWLAKAELFRNGLLGWIVHQLGAIPLRRDQQDLSAMKLLFRYLKLGEVVGLFPEGTRRSYADRFRFLPKGGVLSLLRRAEVAIVPIYIESPYRLFHRQTIHVGCPFQFSCGSRRRLEAEEQQAYLCELMDRIYQAGGESFHYEA